MIVDRAENVILYCALFWIQGKTMRRGTSCPAALYCALFWIQGKTHASTDGG